MIAADARALVLTIRLYTGRYHGEPEWPPAPARLFQALLAGCAKTERLDDAHAAALGWLELLSPPWIAAPLARRGQVVKLWVPNNDLDSQGGDPAAVPSIRTGKQVRPRLFDPSTPLVYAWLLDHPDHEPHAITICGIASELYQLGRGIDFASAIGQLMTGAELTEALSKHPGKLHRPTFGPTSGGVVLACPHRGSLSSLLARYAANQKRFQREVRGKQPIEVFQRSPKASFATVAYDCPPQRALFELHPAGEQGKLSSVPLNRIGRLTELLRDAAAQRLTAAVPAKRDDVERGLVGRTVDTAPRVPSEERIRLVPLPSIGHLQADRGIRRLLVEVPSGNPLRADDVFWAFSGLALALATDTQTVVTRTDDLGMLKRYGVGDGSSFRQWRTVSAAALPAIRRRIDPKRLTEEAKSSVERATEEQAARRAVVQAVRHAGISSPIVEVHVQREPFTAKSVRAEPFASGTRFPKECMWHVSVTFRDPVPGPLVLGDGRFLGLGLMEPVPTSTEAIVFRVVEGLAQDASPLVITEALRRAVMARFQQVIGPKVTLPAFVSGHGPDGQPVQDVPHLAFAYDPLLRRLLIIAPNNPQAGGVEHLRTLSRAMQDFSTLLAGSAGRLTLEPAVLVPEHDPLFSPSTRWRTLTPYVVNRHRKQNDIKQSLIEDVAAACLDAGLPRPRVHVLKAWGEPYVGLSGHVELDFNIAVTGPLLLGRTRYRGGGLFCSVGGDES